MKMDILEKTLSGSKHQTKKDSIRDTTPPLIVVNERVNIVLARYYLDLKAELCKGNRGNFLSMTYEDIFQNAVLWTLQDSKTKDLISDNDIIEYFKKKYKSIEKQIISDSKVLPEMNKRYAKHQQAEKAEEG